MGALYEDVENFFGDIFAWYGRIVARHPLPFVLVPLLVCCLLGFGLFNLEYETDLENLYTPVNSQALRDRSALRVLFGPYSSDVEFYGHQVVDRPAYAELIVRVKIQKRSDGEEEEDGGGGGGERGTRNATNLAGKPEQVSGIDERGMLDVLASPSVDEVRRLYYLLVDNVSIDSASVSGFPGTPLHGHSTGSAQLQYDDLCARRSGRCAVDGYDILFPGSSSLQCIRPDDQQAIQTATALGASFRSAPTSTSDVVEFLEEELGEEILNEEEEQQREEAEDELTLAESTSSSSDAEETGGVEEQVECLPALALKLRFYLNASDATARQRSVQWQDAFIETMKLYRSDVIDVAFVGSDSLQIELRDHVGDDTKYIIISVIAMIVLATVTGCSCRRCDRGACVSGHVTLAYMGVVAALLAILGAFGLLSLLGSKFVNLSSVMPFLVLGIGADDMFQLITEWRKSDRRDVTEDRMATTLRSAAVSITITSLTDLLAFCIGATSPFLGVRNFCACSGVGIFLCYANQLTFFSGCIVLHSRLMMSSACPSTTTIQTTPVADTQDDLPTSCTSSSSTATRVVVVAGGGRRRVARHTSALYERVRGGGNGGSGGSGVAGGGLCRVVSAFIRETYPRALLHWIGKTVVVLLFIVYLCVSVYGVLRVEESFHLESVIPPESYYAKHLQFDNEYYSHQGLSVMFVADQSLDYHRSSVQQKLADFLNRVTASPAVINGSTISWLDAYVTYRRHHATSSTSLSSSSSTSNSGRYRSAGVTSRSTAELFVSELREGRFFHDFPQYRNDVVFSADGLAIAASRFYVAGRRSDTEVNLMLDMRQLAAEAEPAMMAYAPTFVYYERYVSVKKNTLLPVGVTMIGMLFVALVFIPHPIPVTCVSLSMVSVVVGMTGLMHFWDLALSAVTTIQIILGVGICVSFSVHTSHAFMTATGKNRNDRVAAALEKVSVPIVNGAVASLLSTLAMSLGNSYVFVSFYKTMILVFGLGLLHSVVFLPVILSFFGPRRTSKPRVFGGGGSNSTSTPAAAAAGRSSGSGSGHERSPVVGNSIQRAAASTETPAAGDKASSPFDSMAASHGSVCIPLENLPPSSTSNDRHSSVSTSGGGGDRTRRSSLFAGERDGLSGYEGRPVVMVERRRSGYSGLDVVVGSGSPEQLRSISETGGH